jgi:DNA ligase (NAD+)
MDIDGLGERIVEILFNLGLVTTIPQLYQLANKRNELIELDGFSDKSVDSLLEAIEKSKTRSLERLLFGLGIKEVGEKTSKVLARHFESLSVLIKAQNEELMNIPEIGPVVAGSILSYFSSPSNLEMINQLEHLGLNMIYIGKKNTPTDSQFFGKIVVLTGTLEKFSRSEATSILENLGAKVTGSVSKATHYVIYGSQAGSKLEKASELGVSTMSEQDFYDLIQKKVA